MDPMELLSISLDERERRVLTAGLNEWSGPARPTEELAVALGFEGFEDFGLFAVAGLVSVHDHTWTPDRAVAATRWGEIQPALICVEGNLPDC